MLLNRSAHPVILADREWEKGAGLFAVAAIPDTTTGELLLYYLARFTGNPLANVLCLARSTDGRTWSKPVVRDGTNIVMRAANNLMLDRYRSVRQSQLRDKAWGEASAVQKPGAEAVLISREQLAMTERAIAATGDRPAHIFRRFRFDGVLQRDIAAEMGVSISTVEADLRKVYAALAAVRRQFDAG